MAGIHATAIVDPKAQLDDGVEVGPYSIVGPDVRIGAGSRIGAHVVVEGHTTIGRDNVLFQFCSIGGAPQDKKYKGEPTRLEIGDRNTIREFCTFNTGTAQDAGVTRLGSDNLILAYCHLAHDCQVGSHTVFSNNATLAGHVHVGDHVILSGFAAVHQFCRIGDHAFVGMNSSLTQDVPPFMLVGGNPVAVRGVNAEGLRRRGFSNARIGAIRQAFKTLYKSGLTLEEARQALLAQLSPDASAPAAQPAPELITASANAGPAAPSDLADTLGADLQSILAFLDLSTRGIVR
jgi:UDP-N-acetylglucosamine acyltransferase